MAKLNLLVHVNTYTDSNDTNNPSLNNSKWTRDSQGLSVCEPESRAVKLASGQSLSLFSGAVTLTSDNTTTWNISLKPGTSNTYRISHNSGTLPQFRVARNEGSDATTQVTVTKNAKLITFSSTAGTVFDLITGLVIVGDEVRIGDQFNVANRGKFKILDRSATSFTIENEIGVAEGPITLGAGFADQVNIYSTDGVQIGDKIDMVDGFSPVILGTYDITDVSHDYLEFFSADSLPSQSVISNNPEAFLIYRNAKQFLYLESDQSLDLKINGSSITNSLEPMNAGTAKKPGIFMSSSSLKSVEIINKSQNTANVFWIATE